eukprot:2703217-Amphidinium_carterae.1
MTKAPRFWHLPQQDLLFGAALDRALTAIVAQRAGAFTPTSMSEQLYDGAFLVKQRGQTVTAHSFGMDGRLQLCASYRRGPDSTSIASTARTGWHQYLADTHGSPLTNLHRERSQGVGVRKFLVYGYLRSPGMHDFDKLKTKPLQQCDKHNE